MLTKTYRYIFKVFKVVYVNRDTSIAFEQLMCRPNERFEQTNVYLMDESIEGASLEDGLLYIVADTRNPRFDGCIYEIEKCNWYKGSYVCSGDNNLAAIVIKHPVMRQYKAFIESKYSQIYRNDNGQIFFLTSDELVMNQYRTLDEKTGKWKFSKEWCVMTKDQDYFDENILPLTYRLTKEEIAAIKMNEYDDPLNIKKEIFNSKTINNYGAEKQKEFSFST